jgi:PhnB protein
VSTEPALRGAAIPYLIVQDAVKAIGWYESALGFVEVVRLADPGGKVMHAELCLGEAAIMLADEFPDMGYRSPISVGGSSVSILLYVADVDAVFARAVASGADEVMPVADQFDGDRRGTLKDPFGHIWLLATKTESVSVDELRLRFAAMMKRGA